MSYILIFWNNYIFIFIYKVLKNHIKIAASFAGLLTPLIWQVVIECPVGIVLKLCGWHKDRLNAVFAFKEL